MKSILFLLFFSYNLTAQNIKQVFSTKFYDGKTIEQLATDSLINDMVKSNERLLYLNIKTPNGQQEFFRYDDTTYVFREKINSKIVANGNVQFEKIQPLIQDTIISIDLKGLNDDSTIVTQVSLFKTGNWTEMNKNGEVGVGAYFKNKKNGGWYYNGRWIYFNQGEIVGFSLPTKDSLMAHLDWLIEKKWICCTRNEYNSDGTFFKSDWGLQIINDYKCPQVGTFIFLKNGTFTFKELVEETSTEQEEEYGEESIPTFRFGGLGHWVILENGNVQLDFFNKKRDTLKVRYFGKTEIVLEQ